VEDKVVRNAQNLPEAVNGPSSLVVMSINYKFCKHLFPSSLSTANNIHYTAQTQRRVN